MKTTYIVTCNTRIERLIYEAYTLEEAKEIQKELRSFGHDSSISKEQTDEEK